MDQTTLTILLALLPLAGGIVGAFVQSFLHSRREQSNQQQTLKIKAYTDFLQAAAALSGKDGSKHNEARTLLTDARLRILIYGSQEVISNIAIFDRTGSRANTPEGRNTFLPIISSMRSEDSKGKIKKEDMLRILFGEETLA